MKKQILDFTIVRSTPIGTDYSLLVLKVMPGVVLSESSPGQFVQVRIPGAENTFLRRPISINYIDESAGELWLLVRKAGEGTCTLCSLPTGTIINLIYPLGNGFSMPETNENSLLLIGGGVGVAPLLQLGIELKRKGFNPEFLLGARSEADLLELDLFKKYGTVHITTNDGSTGEKGFVVDHTCFKTRAWDKIYCCGPVPMMKAVATETKRRNIDCEVSLENMMACGVGACLCCVENTVKGNVCVCTEGPVFNVDMLNW